MKASLLDKKFSLSRKKALVFQLRQPTWEGVQELYPPPFSEREWARTHNTWEETLDRKTEGWHFPPAPLKHRTTQMEKPRNSRNQEGFFHPSSALLYDKVRYLQTFESGLHNLHLSPHLFASQQWWEATFYTSQTPAFHLLTLQED